MTTIRRPIFVVPLDLGTLTAGSAVAGYPASNLNRHNAIGLTWRHNSGVSSSSWVRGQFAAERTIDFCAIISANAQPGTQYRLRLGLSQAEVDGGSAPYDSGVLDFIDPAIEREDRLYHSHLELDAPEDAIWWRIDISGHTGDFQAADVVLGSGITPSHFYDLDFEYGIKDLGGIDFGRWGVFDEEPGVILRQVNFTLAWQSEIEFEESFRPMIEKLGSRGIVYLCFDPEPTVYRQARTFMGVMGKPPYAKGKKKPRNFEQDYEITSFI